MKGFGDKNQSKNKKITNENKKFNNDLLIKKAFQFQAEGKKLEAAKCYLYLIKNGFCVSKVIFSFVSCTILKNSFLSKRKYYRDSLKIKIFSKLIF